MSDDVVELVTGGHEGGGSDNKRLNLLCSNYMPGTVQGAFKCINLCNTKIQ